MVKNRCLICAHTWLSEGADLKPCPKCGFDPSGKPRRTDLAGRRMVGYLATPYSDPDRDTERLRWANSAFIAAKMIDQGFLILPAVAFGHIVGRYSDRNGSWKSWAELDEELILRCDYLVVGMLDGWKDSVGVRAEVVIAYREKMPVVFADGNGNLMPTSIEITEWLDDMGLN